MATDNVRDQARGTGFGAPPPRGGSDPPPMRVPTPPPLLVMRVADCASPSTTALACATVGNSSRNRPVTFPALFLPGPCLLPRVPQKYVIAGPFLTDTPPPPGSGGRLSRPVKASCVPLP